MTGPDVNLTKKYLGLLCVNGPVASKKFWSSMSLPNLVRLSQIKAFSLPNYAHVNKVSKK
jgi:hypothetical protein